jgi:type VI secretion system protein ImpM
MAEPAPGFFGKAPALGDFVSRGMPPAFLAAWDGWLRMLIASSRARLGETDWLAAWLGMPVWHFGFGAGLVGNRRAFGVLIPSVDRVGRNFPFSIVGQAAPGGVALSTWALRIETLALDTLEDGFEPARLQSELVALGAPAEPVARPAPLPPGWTALSEPADWPAPVEPALAGLAEGETLFWCRGADRIQACMLRSDGLPAEQQAAQLVAGR